MSHSAHTSTVTGSCLFKDDAKHHLLKPSTIDPKEIWNQPWYKERLQTKVLKDLGTKKRLDYSRWRFMKDGLDDFRDGLPPVTKDEFIRVDDGTSNDIQGINQDQSHYLKKLRRLKQGTWSKRFTKSDSCYSRIPPLVRQRREAVDNIERALVEHPFATYKHFIDAIPADLYDDVIQILDPELLKTGQNSRSHSAASSTNEQQRGITPLSETTIRTNVKEVETAPVFEVPQPPPPQQSKRDNGHELCDDIQKLLYTQRNPYKWVKGEKKEGEDELMNQPDEDAHIKGVTRDFCQWVTSLGGDAYNIEEATVHSQFASGYETKPSLLVPIHVVEMQNVPSELLSNVDKSYVMDNKKITSIREVEEIKKQQRKKRSRADPNFGRFKFGEWYLPKKLWQMRDAEEELLDPKEILKFEQSDKKQQSDSLDMQLVPLHGTKAFLDFLKKKPSNVRRPVFMKRADELRSHLIEEDN